MEASFCGPVPLVEGSMKEEDLNYHYNADDLKELGKNLTETLLLYCNEELNLADQISEIKTYHLQKQSQSNPLPLTK